MVYFDPKYSTRYQDWTAARIPYVAYSEATDFQLFTQDVVCSDPTVLEVGAIAEKGALGDDSQGYDLSDIVAKVQSANFEKNADDNPKRLIQSEKDSGIKKFSDGVVSGHGEDESFAKAATKTTYSGDEVAEDVDDEISPDMEDPPYTWNQ